MASRARPYLTIALSLVVCAVAVGEGARRQQTASVEEGGHVRAPVVGEVVPAAPEGEVTTPSSPDGAAATAAAPGAPVGQRSRKVSGGAQERRSAGPARGTEQAQAPVFPGLGTPEALANPNCDPETGRIKFPSPYAPQCARAWPAGGDNGGTTAQGVTADAIRVVALLPPGNNQRADEQTRRQIADTLDIFAGHYEMWGRRLDVRFHKSSGTDEVAQRADAVDAFNRHKPFAAFHAGQSPFPVFAAEMAARGVITIAMAEPWKNTAAQPGFRWGAGSTDDRITWSHAVEYAGKRLQGRPAVWAGEVAARSRTRKIGAISPDSWDATFMRQEAARFGLTITEQVTYPDNNVVALQNRAATLVARLKDAGVTTLIAASDIVATVVLTVEATNQAWFPEWIVTGWGNQDTAVASRLFDQRQWERAFGPGPVNVLVADEHYDLSIMHEWHHGRPAADRAVHGQTRLAAHVLMTGIHVTGPELTPENFRRQRFAADPAGGVWCGCTSSTGVSFGRHAGVPWDDYSSFDDMTEKWWDPRSTGTDEIGITGPGVYWKVDGGKRYRAGQWPTTDPKVFTREGAVERFDRPPPHEQVRRYPHEPHG